MLFRSVSQSRYTQLRRYQHHLQALGCYSRLISQAVRPSSVADGQRIPEGLDFSLVQDKNPHFTPEHRFQLVPPDQPTEDFHCVLPQNNKRCRSRSAAISQYRSLISIPTACRPSIFAASNVVPDPAKGSRMVSPSLLQTRMISAISPTGFCVWLRFSKHILNCACNMVHPQQVSLCFFLFCFHSLM